MYVLYIHTYIHPNLAVGVQQGRISRRAAGSAKLTRAAKPTRAGAWPDPVSAPFSAGLLLSMEYRVIVHLGEIDAESGVV